jgi:mono/diheme cytochrome c family protein
MRRAELIVLVALGACTRPRVEPPVAMAEATAEAPHGRMLFQRYCYKCHPDGAAGLGPALNNKLLPQFAIRTQIRKGLGAMPAFGPHVLSDADVAAIAQFVHDLRTAPPTGVASRP